LEPPRHIQNLTDPSVRTMLLITGMRDNACRERVTAALEAVPGVREVDVNLYRARATIAHARECSINECIRAVVQAGYTAAISVAA
jgi:copper chaperone CopZ